MSTTLGVQPFAHRPGCPLCSIVATPHPRSDINSLPVGPQPHTPWRRDSDTSSLNSATNIGTGQSSTTNVIIYKDANVTAYIEKKFPVSSKGHIIIVLNLHVPSIYTLTSTDLPLLNHIQSLASRLLYSLNPLPPPSSPTPSSVEDVSANQVPLAEHDLPFRVGFITPPFKDSKIPITDHLHAHAYVGTPDLAGWWRGVAYGSLGWYSVQDLIAEIRESTSNNRIKSGYTNRPTAPIDMVPSAGALSGNADGSEDQFLPLPLQVNKAHMSPSPTPSNDATSPTSSTSTATAIYGRRSPVSTTSDFELVVSGSVDLGTGFGMTNRVGNAAATGAAASAAAGGNAPRSPSGLRHQQHIDELEEAEWEDSAATFERREGEAGPGPSTVRSMTAAV